MLARQISKIIYQNLINAKYISILIYHKNNFGTRLYPSIYSHLKKKGTTKRYYFNYEHVLNYIKMT